MTIRTLFNIMLKIVGLFFLRDFFAVLPQLLSTISLLFDFSGMVSPFVALLLSIAGYAAAAYVLLFKTE